MAEDDAIFDPTMKKKKKGKKAVDLSLIDSETGETDKSVVTDVVDAADDTAKTNDKDLEDLTDLLNTKKKKKPKKKVFNLDELEGATQEIEAKDGSKETSAADAVNSNDTAGGAGNEGDAALEDEDLDFNLPKKKKKKKKTHFESAEGGEEHARGDDGEGGADEAEKENETDSVTFGTAGLSGTSAWANSDRDYTYEELLQHVFNIIKEKNPDIIAGEKKRLVMRPPQVLRVGTKKTSFANFIDICKSLHRLPRHMQAFLLAELGTSGSVDANNQLIIKGRFQQKQIENVLRRYIKEYVACQTCRSPETILQKDTRLFFLQCETCGSRRSVASIKSGFQAVTSKRAAIRAKAV